MMPALSPRFRAHPWHGVELGAEAPSVLTAYIELVPTDTLKYEVDKSTGILRVDRPQRYSNVCPTPYGFLPRTYCAEAVGAFCAERTGREGIRGDGDPLDICVLTERVIQHGDVLIRARPIGGLRMLDGREADDKIVAVLDGDAAYGGWESIRECPAGLLDRLRHYFLTYKQGPGDATPGVEIADVYDRDEALEVIARGQDDYRRHFGAAE